MLSVKEYTQMTHGDLRDFVGWILKRVEHPLRKEERGPTVLPYVLLGRKVTLLKKGETEKDCGGHREGYGS